ncbi:RebB family R body protein [Vibrio astriarenae]|uniref:RebB family R body protein n=1 Tax=Vibrio astriarenae TaxID=1481923 RepID=UPI003735EEB4
MSTPAAGLTEAALAETLSLTMHNAVQNQHQSQMTTQASITNVMSQILMAGKPGATAPNLNASQEVAPEPQQAESQPVVQEQVAPEPQQVEEPVEEKELSAIERIFNRST